MTSKIKSFLEELKKQEYRNLRKKTDFELSAEERSKITEFNVFEKIVSLADPIIISEHDDFGFNMGSDFRFCDGPGNVTPNYYRIISQGFDKTKSEIEKSIQSTADIKKKSFGEQMLKYLDLCTEICKKHREIAKANGNERLYKALCRIPENAAESFYEACVFIKLCIYFLRCDFGTHLGLGRFDQYMHPFYVHDKKCGVTDEEILETIEGFFISINTDTDLYFGIQQGDNGQSMALGGFDEKGNSMYNELSDMCLQASLELELIDPKINLRVGKNTPDAIYEKATKLTKCGLGFPQYCNDDVIIPGLIKLGYDKEDALNYTVAACWEFIIPGNGADVPNYSLIDFPMIVSKAIEEHLEECGSFAQLMNFVKCEIAKKCDEIVGTEFEHPENPFLSLFTDGCTETLTSMWHGGTKYNNFGCHGVGIANAADALAAVSDNVYNKKTITKKELSEALKNDFNGNGELRNMLISSPKMGNNDDFVDDIASEIMEAFSENLNNRSNCRGGIWRAGTGSAMEYLRGENCGATADGRKSGTPYSSSFSPSLDIKTKGILSVIQSFTKYDMTRIINGGPLTVEVHDTVFRNDEGIKKVAALVKAFIKLGGHQLQLNSVNRERLLDAQKHPEKYKNLIVRVWGWSGYFNELDVRYQNHIIKRTEYIG